MSVSEADWVLRNRIAARIVTLRDRGRALFGLAHDLFVSPPYLLLSFLDSNVHNTIATLASPKKEHAEGNDRAGQSGPDDWTRNGLRVGNNCLHRSGERATICHE